MARPVIKSSTMLPEMQEYAIGVAQDAIAGYNTEQEIANAIKTSFEKALCGARNASRSLALVTSRSLALVVEIISFGDLR